MTSSQQARRRPPSLAIAGLCAMALAPEGAFAKEAEDRRDDEIIVLGTREQGYRATVAPQTNKSDTPIKETPFSVQVVTRELIKDRGITTVGEALRYVPGFSPQVGFGASNDRFYIRGFYHPLQSEERHAAFRLWAAASNRLPETVRTVSTVLLNHTSR